MVVSEEYKAARVKIAEAIAAARELAKEAFTEESNKFLKDNNIESFSWVQYTPYFNDGDECIFGVRADDYYVQVNGIRLDDYGQYNYDTREVEYPDLPKEAPDPTVWKAVSTFIYQFDEEDLKHMFGDHVEVTITKDGATTEEYEHD
jgi:hypothetical protein